MLDSFDVEHGADRAESDYDYMTSLQSFAELLYSNDKMLDARSSDFSDKLNQYWATMNRQWGQVQQAQTASSGKVNSNLSPSDGEGGKIGVSKGSNWSAAWKDAPWNVDAGMSAVANSWGADHGTGFSAAGNSWSGSNFDSSWELGGGTGQLASIDGTVDTNFDTNFDVAGLGAGSIPGTADANYYSSYRWHQGIDATKNAASSEVHDPAKLKCHVCNVQREMAWDKDAGTFKLIDPADPSKADKTGENLFAACSASLNQVSCEYSAGTCFIEERRTWGYVTQVRAGCKQAQACYMQKYQNFLVKAGRQCWPGDNTGMADKIGRRPYDVALYEWPNTNLGWITNIIFGGASATGTGTSFTSNNAQTGLFVDADYSDFLGIRTPVDYKNGLKESSLCTQCCNSEHNCNFDWQPRTEADWERSFAWNYDATSMTGNAFGTGVEQQPSEVDPVLT